MFFVFKRVFDHPSQRGKHSRTFNRMIQLRQQRRYVHLSDELLMNLAPLPGNDSHSYRNRTSVVCDWPLFCSALRGLCFAQICEDSTVIFHFHML